MTDDDTELPFTLFVASAQLLVGIGLIAFASSSAVRIIGAVVISFALLTAVSAWYHTRQRVRRLSADLGQPDEPAARGGGEPAARGPDDLGRIPASQSTQGARQPPHPEGSRSASPGPHDPGE